MLVLTPYLLMLVLTPYLLMLVLIPYLLMLVLTPFSFYTVSQCVSILVFWSTYYDKRRNFTKGETR
jgi:hypothetical protein